MVYALTADPVMLLAFSMQMEAQLKDHGIDVLDYVAKVTNLAATFGNGRPNFFVIGPGGNLPEGFRSRAQSQPPSQDWGYEVLARIPYRL
jgi:hypothetical protein